LHQGMTVLQAIFMAGGYRDTAEPTEVLVIREKEPNKPELLMVDLQSGLDSVTQVDDVYLLPHDVVMVPKSTIAKMDQFVDQWINQLIPVARSFALNYNMGTLLTQ
jgi:protein involved in polysaccharide export with SLBB domain